MNYVYMTRERVSHVYFPSMDLLLSTKRSYLWNTGERLWLRGRILIALFKRFDKLADTTDL